MTPVRAPRWAMSFADLCLLLLGFFVLLQAQNGERAEVVASMRSAFGYAIPRPQERMHDAQALFERGEAVLKPAEQARLVALGREATRERETISIASEGLGAATRRLDAWELAAARTAAIARAIHAGGLPESRIDVTMPRLASQPGGQRISVRIAHQR